jgi:hypothetical protein
MKIKLFERNIADIFCEVTGQWTIEKKQIIEELDHTPNSETFQGTKIDEFYKAIIPALEQINNPYIVSFEKPLRKQRIRNEYERILNTKIVFTLPLFYGNQRKECWAHLNLFQRIKLRYYLLGPYLKWKLNQIQEFEKPLALILKVVWIITGLFVVKVVIIIIGNVIILW